MTSTSVALDHVKVSVRTLAVPYTPLVKVLLAAVPIELSELHGGVAILGAAARTRQLVIIDCLRNKERGLRATSANHVDATHTALRFVCSWVSHDVDFDDSSPTGHHGSFLDM